MRNLYISLIFSACISSSVVAQTQETDTLPLKMINLNEVIFSANKAEEKKSDVPYNIDVIKSRELELSNPQTSADMLANTGNIMVQKSQAGGGSPIIRGFEASRVLIVIDGVRMNNAIYRTGHLQDVITLDPSMLDRTEVIYGPSSVMYGSDALGGVMHFYTKKPLYGDDKMFFRLNSYARYSSANQEKTGHVDFNLGFKKLASLTSISYSDYDDLRTGNGRTNNQDFGRCYNYAGQNWNGTADSTIRNYKTNIQKKTGYSQVDLMEKLTFKVSEKTEVGMNLQYSTSSNINRYDRLSEYNGANLKFAEWYYGPQNRVLASVYGNIKSQGKLFDNLRITGAFQNIDQQRVSRRFSTNYSSASSSNKRTDQRENVKVYSLNADFRKEIKEKHELSYGAEYVYNDVNSEATITNIYADTTVNPVATRYPNGGSSLSNAAVYLTHTWEISDRFILTDGIRYTSNTLKASFDTSSAVSQFQFPFTSVKQRNQALNGMIGLVASPEKNVRLSLLGSTGFRAPNVDDLAKVFESTGSVIIVPNADLKPEYAYNFEFGVSTTIFENKVKLEGGYYYTLLKNAIVTRKTTFEGKDSIMFNGTLSEVRSSQNVDEAYIQGAWGAISADFTDNVSFKSTLNYTLGEYKQFIPDNGPQPGHDTIVPLDHIPPLFGQTSLIFRFKKFESEIYSRYSAAKLSKDYSLGKEDNELYSADPVNGYMPGWVTFNVKTTFKLTKNFMVNVGVENLFNTHYRVFASGVSSAGRNVVVAIRVKV
ncbi:MAG: TonB-dependent receptor [Bacteroidota bacterium]|nr:TonB-dependent receptor [Bacteroidota bacterium]